MVEVIQMSEEEKAQQEQLEQIEVTELVEGSSLFTSTGRSTVKVTRGGVEKLLVLSIKSSGITEFMDQFSREAPQPPTIHRLVKPDDPMGKELRLARNKHVQMFDYTDAQYIKDKEKHDSDLGLKVVLMGIDAAIKDKDGNEIEDEQKKLGVLRGMGLTSEQFTQIFNDIRNLTRLEGASEDDFLE